LTGNVTEAQKGCNGARCESVFVAMTLRTKARSLEPAAETAGVVAFGDAKAERPSPSITKSAEERER
jgi:hypothetical protein